MIGEPRVVVRKEASVPTDIKEFISFWIENSIHARPIMGQGGSSQDSTDLARRLLAAAEELGLPIPVVEMTASTRTVAEGHGDRVADRIGRDQVLLPVAVEVAHRRRFRDAARGHGGTVGEAAVTVAEPDRERGRALVDGDHVGAPVAVEVGGEDIRGLVADGEGARGSGREGAVTADGRRGEDEQGPGRGQCRAACPPPSEIATPRHPRVPSAHR